MDSETFLEHYGVKGMRWGVINKEPSSKSNTQHKTEKKETKAKKFDQKSKDIQKQIDELKKQNPSTPYSKKVNRMEIRELEGKKAISDKAAQDVRAGKLTDRQKKALKGAAVVGVIVAAGVTYSMLQSGEGRRLTTKGAMFVKRQDSLFPFKMKPKLMRDMDVDELMRDVVPQVNPGYGGIGTKMNCRRCTMAYELRRRGYDVTATRTTNAHGQTIFGMETVLNPSAPAPIASGRISSVVKTVGRFKSDPNFLSSLDGGGAWGKNPIGDDDKDLGLFKALRKQPNGSRGEVGVKWMFGGGHSMAYEIVNGKPVIFDTQSGKVFKNVTELRKEFGDIGGIAEAGYTRLDDIPMNSDFLLRWVKNA